MSKEKEYTREDVLAILDYAKGKDISSTEILKYYLIDKSNRIEELDEHSLSVVGVFEHPIYNKMNEEIGKLIVFNYTGVGGGWHYDILNDVESKYFGDEPYWDLNLVTEGVLYERAYLLGEDMFSDKSFDEWERQNGNDDFRIFKQNIADDSEFVIIYDNSEENISYNMLDDYRRNHGMFWDGTSCNYFITNIDDLKYINSKKIVEERIKNRLKI